MSLSRRITVAISLTIFFAVPQLSFAEEPAVPVWRDWQRVVSLDPGRRVTVKRWRGFSQKLNGSFVSAQPDSIVIQTKDGQVTVAKDEVREVKARRRGMRRSPWIGIAVGFAVGALLTAVVDDFQQPNAALIYGAAGAGLGYLGGLGVRSIGQSALIYRAPEKPKGN
jgi:hypothetical protein